MSPSPSIAPKSDGRLSPHIIVECSRTSCRDCLSCREVLWTRSCAGPSLCMISTVMVSSLVKRWQISSQPYTSSWASLLNRVSRKVQCETKWTASSRWARVSFSWECVWTLTEVKKIRTVVFLRSVVRGWPTLTDKIKSIMKQKFQ